MKPDILEHVKKLTELGYSFEVGWYNVSGWNRKIVITEAGKMGASFLSDDGITDLVNMGFKLQSGVFSRRYA